MERHCREGKACVLENGNPMRMTGKPAGRGGYSGIMPRGKCPQWHPGSQRKESLMKGVCGIGWRLGHGLYLSLKGSYPETPSPFLV